ncbi:MAG: NUDIX domain-containing protein [Actinomycetota bacterium]|nr:NUDIX domain-containing protein [Actinomycetota bacterium]
MSGAGVTEDPAAVPVRPAATVMLVDDRPDLHVLVLRRNAATIFAGGMWVFPGGRVDPDDEVVAARVGPSRDERPDAPGAEPVSPAHRVAAVRETFEEAGLLLARPVSGGGAPLEPGPRTGQLRQALNAGEVTFGHVLDELGLVCDLDAVHYVSRWVTPQGPPRRFDARFFVARPPVGQRATHDDDEAVASRWARPHELLAAFERGEAALMTPTRRMIRSLAAFECADDVVEAARRARAGEIVRSSPDGEGGWEPLLPGDAGYDVADESIETGWVRLRLH